jgi:adenylyl-sulfate kinase
MKNRLLLKSIGYRVFSTLTTGVIAWLITGNLKVAFAMGLWDTIVKIFLYYFYEELVERLFFLRVKPSVVWMTGLSGAGKTTVAKALIEKLAKKGQKAVLLDGDEIRKIFPSTGFDEKSRLEHIARVAHTANLLAEQGSLVIVSLISPFEKARRAARELCGENFIEVYVSASLETCEKRDVKGLYAKARKGEIKDFTGIDSPYEAPLSPELVLNTENTTPEECASAILKLVKK